MIIIRFKIQYNIIKIKIKLRFLRNLSFIYFFLQMKSQETTFYSTFFLHLRRYNNCGDWLMHEYIECIFVENLIISYITIYQVSIFTKIKLKKTNIIIGILILSFYETLSYYFSINSTAWASRSCPPGRTPAAPGRSI